ncbi:MAG: hypothetical protein HGA43_11335 [Nitrospirae bacterium]|nr:hypothetical protein [Nitrospirota bacterium]
MNVCGKGLWGSMLVVVLVLGALLSACGTDQPTGVAVQTVSSVVTVGTPTVGLKTCTSCHTSQTSDWMLTKHANVEPLGNLYSAGNPTLGQIAGCTKNCHDSNGDGAGNFFTANYTGNIARPVVSCESCHSGGQMHVDQGGAGPIGLATTTAMVIGTTSSLQASAQFRTCTGCHELLDPNDPLNTAATPTHLTSVPTPTGSEYVITDTHFATFGDFTGTFDGATGQNKQNATGYAMNFSSETVCTDCHNPHKTPDINREWALSAHADIFVNNDEFSYTQDPLGYFSGAWVHYNWGNAASYRACQRCHTTTGFSTYTDTLRAGNTQLAVDIQRGLVTLLQSSPVASFKPEMLKCNGCHTDNKGTLRNPGAITAIYDFPIPVLAGGKPYSLASYVYPDVKGSNVCMACHTGRESGDTIKGLNDPTRVNIALKTAGTNSFFDFGIRGFINSHYLTAGGTVFTATGFEFEGRSYENSPSYRHADIGSSAVPNSGSNGPCVGCHMSRPGKSGNHLFMPVTRSTTSPGHIDGIASQVCIYCHTVSGAGGLEDLINERKEEYHEAVEAAIYVLDKRGFYFRPSNPYFFKLRTASTSTTKALISSGSYTVTAAAGANPGWSSFLATGATVTNTAADYFKVNADGIYYRIEAATTDTLTLREPYEGAPVTNAEFTIIQGRSGATAGWLTQAGKGIVPAAVTDLDTTGNTTGRYNLGAAFNLNLLEHDPGGYVHNRIYSKRLLYDSIDWADDNLLNFSVGTTLRDLVVIDGAAPVWKAGAMKYLLPSGVLGIAAERP